MKDVVIFDLDGTLANGKHRNHAVPSAKDSCYTWAWNRHNMLCSKDSPIEDTITMCNLLYVRYKVVILTGRCDISKQLTVDWLRENHVHYDSLIMRKEDDHRPDTVVKEEELLLIGLDRILCCFDDLEHVADMIRGLGLTCYLVNKYKPRVDTIEREVIPAEALNKELLKDDK
jgi:hypothetical protein